MRLNLLKYNYTDRRELGVNFVDRFINCFHIVFKRVNCSRKICKFRFVALCEGNVGGRGLTISASNLIFSVHPWNFPLQYWPGELDFRNVQPEIPFTQVQTNVFCPCLTRTKRVLGSELRLHGASF